jgi:hypothetical protein
MLHHVGLRDRLPAPAAQYEKRRQSAMIERDGNAHAAFEGGARSAVRPHSGTEDHDRLDARRRMNRKWRLLHLIHFRIGGWP